MTAIIDLLKNKKMYGIAVVLVIIVIAEKVLGWDVPGVDVGDDWLGFILAALGLGATKAAIVKSGSVY
jgi:hypothetical protein